MLSWKLIVSSLISPKNSQPTKMIFARRAIERNIEIIGEALSRIITKDETIKISNARKIVDTRNRIIHGYDSVSDEIIWGIVINHIPILQTEVKGLLGE